MHLCRFMMLLMRSCMNLKQSQSGVLHALFGDSSERIRIKTLLRLFGIVLEFDAERKTSQLATNSFSLENIISKV